MQMTCPCCHAHVPLEAALQDEAGRELVGMLAAMQPELARVLVHYIGYFRPAKQQLGWGRALRLVREATNLCVMAPPLVWALNETARVLDEKRAQPGWKPLGNHNYLKRVLESVPEHLLQSPPATPGGATPPVPASKTGRALVALEAMKR
jgi:hypothetical protein